MLHGLRSLALTCSLAFRRIAWWLDERIWIREVRRDQDNEAARLEYRALLKYGSKRLK
jgi:hypothetical protein